MDMVKSQTNRIKSFESPNKSSSETFNKKSIVFSGQVQLHPLKDKQVKPSVKSIKKKQGLYRTPNKHLVIQDDEGSEVGEQDSQIQNTVLSESFFFSKRQLEESAINRLQNFDDDIYTAQEEDKLKNFLNDTVSGKTFEQISVMKYKKANRIQHQLQLSSHRNSKEYNKKIIDKHIHDPKHNQNHSQLEAINLVTDYPIQIAQTSPVLVFDQSETVPSIKDSKLNAILKKVSIRDKKVKAQLQRLEVGFEEATLESKRKSPILQQQIYQESSTRNVQGLVKGTTSKHSMSPGGQGIIKTLIAIKENQDYLQTGSLTNRQHFSIQGRQVQQPKSEINDSFQNEKVKKYSLKKRIHFDNTITQISKFKSVAKRPLDNNIDKKKQLIKLSSSKDKANDTKDQGIGCSFDENDIIKFEPFEKGPDPEDDIYTRWNKEIKVIQSQQIHNTISVDQREQESLIENYSLIRLPEIHVSFKAPAQLFIDEHENRKKQQKHKMLKQQQQSDKIPDSRYATFNKQQISNSTGKTTKADLSPSQSISEHKNLMQKTSKSVLMKRKSQEEGTSKINQALIDYNMFNTRVTKGSPHSNRYGNYVFAEEKKRPRKKIMSENELDQLISEILKLKQTSQRNTEVKQEAKTTKHRLNHSLESNFRQPKLTLLKFGPNYNKVNDLGSLKVEVQKGYELIKILKNQEFN